jgi:2-polyprenyl-3-methyl-5-hydroxy-6-metoxy-1,4-benzoquinol methylase
MPNLPYLDKPSPWSSHSRISTRLKSLPSHSKVLDVGCASGTIARMCGDKSLLFYGIETNPEWGAIASPFYEELWTCALDEMPDEALRGYEAIVLADVLEHMPAPDLAIARLVRLQTPGCIFIISVPNVANLWVRLHLLSGHFDYAERGILDRTHLRFYTRDTFIQLVEEAGLEITCITPTPIPLELKSPFFTKPPGRQLLSILAWLTSFLPTLLGYQFILEAKKP